MHEYSFNLLDCVSSCVFVASPNKRDVFARMNEIVCEDDVSLVWPAVDGFRRVHSGLPEASTSKGISEGLPLWITSSVHGCREPQR